MINWSRFKNPTPGTFPPQGWSDLIEAISQLEIRSFINGRFSIGTGGTCLTAAPQSQSGGGGAAPNPRPFSIIRVDSDDAGQIHVFDDQMFQEVSLDDGDFPAFDCPEIGGKIWVEINVENPEAITASLEYGVPDDDTWPDYPQPYEGGGTGYSKITKARILIAEVTDPEVDPRPSELVVSCPTGGDPEFEDRQITQMYSHNLQLVGWAIDGVVGLMHSEPQLDYPATPL